MSNELATILQNNPALVQTGLDADTLAVAGGGQTEGNKRISIRGGVFRKLVGGKEVSAIEDRHMNVIVVKMAHNASRTFYADAYKEGVKISPTCWSNDSNTPDKEVPNPQAKTCAECKFSAKGSGSSGIGSACRLSWRLAVVLPNDPSGDVMQLVLPATSCFGKEVSGKWPFRPYIQMLASNNVSAGAVVTRMQFDTNSQAPKVLFSPASAVSESDYEIIKKQADSKAAENAVKLTVYQTDESSSEKAVEAQPAPVEVPPSSDDNTGDVAEAVEQPQVRAPEKDAGDKVNDPSDIIKKWSGKASS